MKIEAMTETEIRSMLEYPAGMSEIERRLILAWATAKAEAERIGFEYTNHCITAERVGDGVRAFRTNYDDDDPQHNWTDTNWLNAVLDRIGWPKEA